MATSFPFNYDLGPKQAQGTSIGDMVSLARGIQAYQQAEQINPLAVREQAARTKVAEETTTPTIEKATAEAGSSKLKLSSEQTNTLYGLAAGVLNDPRMRSKDPNDSLGALYEAKQRASTFNIPKETIDGVFTPLMTAAQREPKMAYQAISNILQSRLTPETQAAMQLGGTVEINGVKYQYAPASGRLEPIGGGQPGQPAPQPAAQPAPQATPQAAPQKNNEPKLVPIDQPMQGIQMNAQQLDRYNAGAKDFESANERQIVSRDSALAASQIKRNLKEAAGSKPGQIVRAAGKAFFGNPELDTLVKNLAEQQVRQAKLMGLDTVAAQNDQKIANGSEDITAEALAHIVERAEAMNLASQKYNSALTKMQEKYGKQNAYIHNDNFKRAWANNYDPVAFLIQNINASNIPKKEKEAAIDYYTSKMTQDQIDDLARKMKNLKRLERGDF